eukprot:6491834-Amphidinium_carterae.5
MQYNKEEHNYDELGSASLAHFSRHQSKIALSSAEAELYAMGHATIESQHIKQVIEEMAIPEMDTDNVTVIINTDSSSGMARPSWLLDWASKGSKNMFNYFSYTYRMNEGNPQSRRSQQHKHMTI